MDSPILARYAALLPIGFAAGFINTIGGGGSLLSLPMLIFMGLPGTVANATNRVANLAQNIFATLGFRAKGVALPTPYAYYLALVSLVGGFVGSLAATLISNAHFNRILAAIMLLALVSIVVDPRSKQSGADELLSPVRRALGVLLSFLAGGYGGFLQVGVGFLIIASLSHLHHFSMAKINYIKVFNGVIYTGVSVLVFALEGKIVWVSAIVLAVGQGMGAGIASRWSVERGERWIKPILVVVIAVLAIKLWFF